MGRSTNKHSLAQATPAPPRLYQPSGKPLPSRWTVCVGSIGSNVRCISAPHPPQPSPAPPRIYQPSGKTTSQPGDCLHAEQGSNVRCIPALAPHQAQPAGDCLRREHREQCPLYLRSAPAPAPRRPGYTSQPERVASSGYLFSGCLTRCIDGVSLVDFYFVVLIVCLFVCLFC